MFITVLNCVLYSINCVYKNVSDLVSSKKISTAIPGDIPNTPIPNEITISNKIPPIYPEADVNGRRIYPFNKDLQIYGGFLPPPFDTLKYFTRTYGMK